MFTLKKQTALRVVVFLILITLTAAAAAIMLYYHNINTLNTHQGFRGIFV